MSGYQDSNLGPPAPKAGALMLLFISLNRLSIKQLACICFLANLKRLTSWLNLITKQEVLNNNLIISLWLEPHYKYNNFTLNEQHYSCFSCFGYEFANSPYKEEYFKIRTHIKNSIRVSSNAAYATIRIYCLV